LLRPRFIFTTAPLVFVLLALAAVQAFAASAPAPKPIVPHPLTWYTTAVENSVSAARLQSPVPKVLSPTLAQLPHDNPGGEKSCVTLGGLGLRCTLGDLKAKRTFMVLGDSHAAAWLPALAYFGRIHHWRVIPLVHAGCTLGVATSGGATCKAWWPQALARISAVKPGFVVVAQYYDPRIPTSQMYAGAGAELRAFKSRVRKVIFMEDPPRHPQINPEGCLKRAGATLGECTLSYPAELTAEHTQIASIVTANHDHYMPTKRWFCFGGKCPIVVGRTIAYWDTDHMTITYSRQIAPAVSYYLGHILTSS
jgi:hypothetical protein